MNNHAIILPRLIRLKDAPFYLGMDRNRFNEEVRLYLTDIPVGKQGIAFDRLELDAFVEHYIKSNGVPGQPLPGDKSWDSKEMQGSLKKAKSGILIKSSKVSEFAKVLDQLGLKKPKDS